MVGKKNIPFHRMYWILNKKLDVLGFQPHSASNGAGDFDYIHSKVIRFHRVGVDIKRVKLVKILKSL